MENFIPRAARGKIVREARIFVAIYSFSALAALVFESWLPLVFWVIPALFGQPALRLFLLAEHSFCPLIPDMLSNTRTTRTNWLVRRLAWNMPYHVEHHLFPGVPFHMLPKVHRSISDHLPVTAPGYANFHRRMWRRLAAPRRSGGA